MSLSAILDTDLLIKAGMALACSFIIGIERQIRGKPMGVRTSMIICLGTMTFVLLGGKLSGMRDTTRVLGQVVTGVGFLGAGVIMNKEGLVSGVTSAAVVWVLAAIGAAVGLGEYVVAVTISFFTLLVLVSGHWIESVMSPFRHHGPHTDDRSSDFGDS